MDRWTTPRWMTVTLFLAGVYNLVWGAAVVLAPLWWFRVAGLEAPLYPQIWQCVGMIVGVYGIGYLAAASNPVHHWPIVLVGFLGKVFGPIGFAWGAARGELSWAFGVVIIFNDLVWWVPFALMLRRALQVHLKLGSSDERPDIPFDTALAQAVDQSGRSLGSLSDDAPQLVVFLRHTGCTFCREALADLRVRRAEIEQQGAQIILVHMGDDASAARIFTRYGLGDVPRVSDPDQGLYRAFGLARGRLGQLFGPFVWWRGVQTMLRGHLVGPLEGDGLQMPGAFVVRNGHIVRAFRHETAADRPDYCELATGQDRKQKADSRGEAA